MRDFQARYWGACALSAQVHTFRLSLAGLQPIGLPFKSPSYLCILFHRDQVTFDMGVMVSCLRCTIQDPVCPPLLLTDWASSVRSGLASLRLTRQVTWVFFSSF